MYTIRLIIPFLLSALLANTAMGQPSVVSGKGNAPVFVIQANQPRAVVQPTMYGVFFEDINMGADGGLYAEMVKNRSFEFSRPLMGWKLLQQPYKEGTATVLNRGSSHTANPRFLRILLNPGTPALGLVNEGFRGMGIKKGLRYDFSFMYRTQADDLALTVTLLDSSGNAIGSVRVAAPRSGDSWKKAEAALIATKTTPKGSLEIRFVGKGTIDLDMISLFPADTWKGRKGGMRADMVQALADMKPGFIRFPGGCIVEGFDLSQRYQWKKTIGPLEERQLIINRWNFEFPHRATPDYFQSFGLGFFEYFQLAEDIGAAPLPILNCGMACQFNSAELAPLDQLDPYVQDALDLIEFANGPVNSTWGRKRAEMGHPEPFHMNMIGIGNENWGPQYLERLAVFQKALQEKYPDIKIIASSGTGPDGERFEYLNERLRRMKIDFVDEHYYRPPEWFFGNAARYDDYPRTGSKVFAGEYASHVSGVKKSEHRNNWLAALSEAAFLTGLERNADVVEMASYAPLFAHYDGWQWTPDLIWVDNLHVYPTPDYYVQQLYSLHKGTRVVPLTWNGKPVAGQDSLYASSVLDEATGELVVKIVNAQAGNRQIRLDIRGISRKGERVQQILMQHDQLSTFNGPDATDRLEPVSSEIALKGATPVLNMEAYSFLVLRIPYQKVKQMKGS
ncbi:alpha-L-arabinofuranosidase C-terminal domain-containing protein [Niabella terrae]